MDIAGPASGPLQLLAFLLAIVTLPVAVTLAVQLARGQRTLTSLSDVPLTLDAAPPVSVIIPARNEAAKLESALRSVLDQDYAGLEVIALDDRSSDGTGRILDRLADRHPQLRVIHIEELPAGWLGKVNALHTGAGRASGAVLLFTDADVVMEPSAVRRAVSRMMMSGLDHVAVAAKLTAPGRLLDLVEGAFVLGGLRLSRPWRAPDPKSDRFVGLGAFNMVRRHAYDAIGGHRPLAMRPVDDLELGQTLKRRGFKQEMLLGGGLVSVEWYASVAELARGLRKNAFAAVGYRLLPLAALTLAALAIDVWPWVGVLATAGPTRWLNAAIVLTAVLSYADTAPRYGLRRWPGIALPVGVLILLYSTWAAALSALLNREITWRGTRYPLEQLKKRRRTDGALRRKTPSL